MPKGPKSLAKLCGELGMDEVVDIKFRKGEAFYTSSGDNHLAVLHPLQLEIADTNFLLPFRKPKLFEGQHSQ